MGAHIPEAGTHLFGADEYTSDVTYQPVFMTRTVTTVTAFRMALFFGHISVSLYGKSYNTPTGFHTFYVVHILITTCWVSSPCSKIGPAPLDPSRSLACY